jgi:hypothetical protein
MTSLYRKNPTEVPQEYAYMERERGELKASWMKLLGEGVIRAFYIINIDTYMVNFE